MTKFEQIGMNRQLASKTQEEAQKNFSNSCQVCCARGLRIECDKCAIACVHEETLACFDDFGKKTRVS